MYNAHNNTSKKHFETANEKLMLFFWMFNQLIINSNRWSCNSTKHSKVTNTPWKYVDREMRSNIISRIGEIHSKSVGYYNVKIEHFSPLSIIKNVGIRMKILFLCQARFESWVNRQQGSSIYFFFISVCQQ